MTNIYLKPLILLPTTRLTTQAFSKYLIYIYGQSISSFFLKKFNTANNNHKNKQNSQHLFNKVKLSTFGRYKKESNIKRIFGEQKPSNSNFAQISNEIKNKTVSLNKGIKAYSLGVIGISDLYKILKINNIETNDINVSFLL